jgi:hypothetical protein
VLSTFFIKKRRSLVTKFNRRTTQQSFAKKQPNKVGTHTERSLGNKKTTMWDKPRNGSQRTQHDPIVTPPRGLAVRVPPAEAPPCHEHDSSFPSTMNKSPEGSESRTLYAKLWEPASWP